MNTEKWHIRPIYSASTTFPTIESWQIYTGNPYDGSGKIIGASFSKEEADAAIAQHKFPPDTQ